MRPRPTECHCLGLGNRDQSTRLRFVQRQKRMEKSDAPSKSLAKGWKEDAEKPTAHGGGGTRRFSLMFEALNSASIRQLGRNIQSSSGCDMTGIQAASLDSTEST